MAKLDLRSVILARAVAAAAAMALAGVASAAPAGAPAPLTLTLKGHRFTPSTLAVPAGARVRVILINRDPATEEFDSHDLRVEQLVTPMGKVTFDIGPLRPGEYSFMGEFHAGSAQGKIVALAAGR
jgi:plastocyanin